ncbi:MAG TPA: flagellar hook capping FlgD N-terminal domain-containing protein [Verrucomicrobiae bacterium]|nr:flagellar hook capping FlgD N-terminal domain-containing protein [Verrucomicrobiae bacterium]
MDISSVLNTPATQYDFAQTGRAHKNMLGQEDFLKLLVTKMSSQDPMNPAGDSEFIAQMAQFSTLEQSKSMTADIAMLKAQQEVLTANGLIGRTVTVSQNDKQVAQGTVTSVAMNDDGPSVVINGKNYSLEDVSLISPFSSAV